MAFINWDDRLSVGVPSIDDEHKKLIGLINDFYQDIYEKSPWEKIVETVRGLKEYTTYHFATEERYMSNLGFPGYVPHKAEHELFVKAVNDYQRKLDDGKFIVSVEITNFIKDWIKNHILGTDKKYSGFFVSHGVK